MSADIIIGLLLSLNGAYAWWYIAKHKEKVPPWLVSTKGILLCLVAIIAGLFLIVAGALSSGH